MEQERERPGPLADLTAEPFTDDSTGLLEYAAVKQKTDGDDRRAAALRINDWLVKAGAASPDAAKVKVILEALERKLLDDLMDVQGREARALAVETVLAFGFPWALQIRPEDLAFARQMAPEPMKPVGPRGKHFDTIARVAAGGLICQVFGALTIADKQPYIALMMLAAALPGLIGVIGLAKSKTFDGLTGSAFAFVLCAVFGVVGAALSDGPMLFAGVVACFVMMLIWRTNTPDPRDDDPNVAPFL